MLALDRQSAKRVDDAYLDQQLSDPASRFIVLVDAKPVIRSSADRTAASLATFTRHELPGGPPHLDDVLFLGLRHDTGAALLARMIPAEEASRLDPGGTMLAPAVDLRSLAMQGVLEPEELATAATAAALVNWHGETRYCGRCGNPTLPREGGWSRHCSACQSRQFPRTDPVVIMLVTAGDRCVLARQPAFPEGMMSALAGFLEPGETIEAAVRRETLEEIGIKAAAVHYQASQPWPFPHSLMIGCVAEGTYASLGPDPDELEFARWFTRAEVRQLLSGNHPDGLWVPGPHAIARWLIAHFAIGNP